MRHRIFVRLPRCVCAVWRRFDDINEVSSILYSYSTNRGKTFGKAKLIADICPFDQVTPNGTEIGNKEIVSFRASAFPVITGDGDNFYIFWSDRGYAAASNKEAPQVHSVFASSGNLAAEVVRRASASAT